MIYVFDTSSFIVLGHYFPQRFPSFWQNFNDYVISGRIISVREVYKELKNKGNKKHLDDWIEKNKNIFIIPNEKETDFVKEIFRIPHFQQIVTTRHRLSGMPVADPFIIAVAKIRKGIVVTEENKKEHAARIPNICEYFDIAWTNLNGFMEQEKWKY